MSGARLGSVGEGRTLTGARSVALAKAWGKWARVVAMSMCWSGGFAMNGLGIRWVERVHGEEVPGGLDDGEGKRDEDGCGEKKETMRGREIVNTSSEQSLLVCSVLHPTNCYQTRAAGQSYYDPRPGERDFDLKQTGKSSSTRRRFDGSSGFTLLHTTRRAVCLSASLACH